MAFRNKNGLTWDQILDNVNNGTVPEKTYPTFVTDIVSAIDAPIVAATHELHEKAYEADANFQLDREAELDKLANALKNQVAHQDALAGLALTYLTRGDTGEIERLRDAHDLIKIVINHTTFDTARFETDAAYRGFTLAANIGVSKYGPSDRVEKTIILLLWAIAIENK